MSFTIEIKQNATGCWLRLAPRLRKVGFSTGQRRNT